MSMNGLIDRLLVLALVAVVAGAAAGLSAAGVHRVGELCGAAAIVATVATLCLQR